MLRRLLARLVRRSPAIRYTHSWSIGIYAGPTPYDLTDAPGVANPVLTRHHVRDVRAAFVADPFMICAGGRWHMFFEVMNAATRKGQIGLAVSDDGKTWTYDSLVLGEPFHLSYPCVFEWEGEHYMIPESHELGTVRLYVARRFPRDWVFVAALVEGAGASPVDATPFRWDGRWWMFVETEPLTAHTLRLFHAERIEGPWREHPRSPVLTGNPHIARPAGRVIVDGAQPVRFGQSDHPAYGLNVSAFVIEELTERSYRERPVLDRPILAGSGSGWNAAGMHHVDGHRVEPFGWVACVDGWSRVDRRELYAR